MRRARLLLLLLITPLASFIAQTTPPAPAKPPALPQQQVGAAAAGHSAAAVPGSPPPPVPRPGRRIGRRRQGSGQRSQMAQQAAAVEEDPDWAVTLERIATSVVSIEVDATRAFDTEWNSSAQATGFVVDAERGLILTNRHVVTPGPVTSEATFLNREEVQLYPGVSRSGARLRLLSLRPGEAALHQAEGAAAVSGRRADRARDPRGRQQRGRAAVDSRRHARAPRS